MAEGQHRFFVGWAMIALLAGGALVSGLTFLRAPEKLFTAPAAESVMRGKAAAVFQDAYEKNLVIRDGATQLWGAVKYALFSTGNEGAVMGRQGWVFTDEEYKTPPGAEKEMAHKLALIGQVRDYLAAHDIVLAVVLVPAKARIYSEYTAHPLPPFREALYGRFIEGLHTQAIRVVDVRAAFSEAKDNAPLYMRTDTHWTPQGAEIAARAVAAAVRDIALPHRAFSTEEGKRTWHEGDLLRFIPTGIFKRWIGPRRETYDSRRTLAAPTPQDASALFGTQEIAVALVGTSYSQQEAWNFEGALKQALQADVVNTASEGKGPIDPMAGFLAGTDMDHTTLKLVIWEFPERFIPVAYPEKEILPQKAEKHTP